MEYQLDYIYNNEILPITVIKSKRKSITLSVDYACKIIVKAPIFMNGKDIKSFVNNQNKWINKRITHIKNSVTTFSFLIGDKIPFKGNELEISHKSNNKNIEIKDDTIYIPNLEKIENTLLRWYKEVARKEIIILVDKYTQLIGLDYNKIFIKSQKTRWGSCSSKKNLNFNWKIILLSPVLINYLVIHEVCHLKEMNHSSNFWNLVASYDSEYKIHRKQLQDAGFYTKCFLSSIT